MKILKWKTSEGYLLAGCAASVMQDLALILFIVWFLPSIVTCFHRMSATSEHILTLTAYFPATHMWCLYVKRIIMGVRLGSPKHKSSQIHAAFCRHLLHITLGAGARWAVCGSAFTSQSTRPRCTLAYLQACHNWDQSSGRSCNFGTNGVITFHWAPLYDDSGPRSQSRCYLLEPWGRVKAILPKASATLSDQSEPTVWNQRPPTRPSVWVWQYYLIILDRSCTKR